MKRSVVWQERNSLQLPNNGFNYLELPMCHGDSYGKCPSGNPSSLAASVFNSHVQFILKQLLKPELASYLVTYKVVSLYDMINQSNL